MERLTPKNYKGINLMGSWIPPTIKNAMWNKLGKLEDLEEQIGCPLDVLFKAFELFVDWIVACDFGYDNIPDEYETYKKEIENMDYEKGLMYIAIQEAKKIKADRSE